MKWTLWALLLIAQNATFTWVSRARNSSSLGYHAVASVASNGVWFACQVLLLQEFFALFGRGGSVVPLMAFYTACTVTGSVGMHYVSMKWLHRYENGREQR